MPDENIQHSRVHCLRNKDFKHMWINGSVKMVETYRGAKTCSIVYRVMLIGLAAIDHETGRS